MLPAWTQLDNIMNGRIPVTVQTDSDKGVSNHLSVCVCVGADADPAEWPPLPGDRYHRQGNGKEVWQVLQEDALSVFTKRSKVKVG